MLKNNKLNLLISIVCAIVLWAYITTVVNPSTERTFRDIDVVFANKGALNDRGYTVSEEEKPTVDVTVAGPRSEVINLDDTDIRATADLAGYDHKGIAAILVNVSTPNDIELVQVRPDVIQVDVIELISVYKPVVLEFEEDFPMEQEPGFIQISPSEMEVSGVAEVVDSIDHLRALVKAGDLTEEISTFRVDVEAIDKAGNVVYNNVGLSQSTVEVTGALCTTKQVPLRVDVIGEANESVEITDTYIPSFVTIRGAAAAVEGVTEVEGAPVDLTNITMTEEIPIQYPTLPDGVEIAEVSQNLSVRIEVQGIARKEFIYTADMIAVDNLISSLSGHVNTGRVTVTILAPQDVLDAITQEDIRLSVDASAYRRTVSAVEMDVIATYEVELRGIEIEPAKVRVTLIEAG